MSSPSAWRKGRYYVNTKTANRAYAIDATAPMLVHQKRNIDHFGVSKQRSVGKFGASKKEKKKKMKGHVGESKKKEKEM